MISITFLGTGSSDGVPLIGCACQTCRSKHPHNRRLRASLLIEDGSHRVLIDASSDLRYQALSYDISKLDAIFFTHADADHISGIPDLRAMNWCSSKTLPIYAEKHQVADLWAIDSIYHQYAYAFNNEAGQKGRPSLMYHNIKPNQSVSIGSMIIESLRVMHGDMPILAFKIGRFAYLTDVSYIADDVMMALIDQVDTLVLNAVRLRPHPRHFHLEQAIEVATKINAKQTYFTHMSHDIEYESTMRTLPSPMALAHDGLIITI